MVIGCGGECVAKDPSEEEDPGEASLCCPIKGMSLIVEGDLWYVRGICCDFGRGM